MHLAFQALGVVLDTLIESLGNDKSRLDCQATRAIDKIITVQKSQGIVKALLAHIRQNLKLQKVQD